MINLSGEMGCDDLLYFPWSGRFDWLASPSASRDCDDDSLLVVGSDYYIHYASVYGNSHYAVCKLRPVIKLPTSVVNQ